MCASPVPARRGPRSADDLDLTTQPSTELLAAEGDMVDTMVDYPTRPPAVRTRPLPLRGLVGPWPAVGFAATAVLLAGLTWAAMAARLPPAARLGLWALLALAWCAQLLVLYRLLSHLARVAGAVQRVVQLLRNDDLGGAIDVLRSASLRGRTPLHAAAGEVQQLLGERERRWRARVRLSGDWYWETDAQHRISWLSEDLASHRKLGLEPQQLLA